MGLVAARDRVAGGPPRLSKGGFEYWSRSYLDPVWTHYIRSPVRVWSQDGIDEETLAALAEQRFGELRRPVPDPVGERLQLRGELDAALIHLRQVHGSYLDADWRREHRGGATPNTNSGKPSKATSTSSAPPMQRRTNGQPLTGSAGRLHPVRCHARSSSAWCLTGRCAIGFCGCLRDSATWVWRMRRGWLMTEAASDLAKGLAAGTSQVGACVAAAGRIEGRFA